MVFGPEKCWYEQPCFGFVVPLAFYAVDVILKNVLSSSICILNLSLTFSDVSWTGSQWQSDECEIGMFSLKEDIPLIIFSYSK